MSVYYIHSPDTDRIKIGFAGDPRGRLGKMQVDSPTRLVLLALEEGGRALEARRHREFSSLRERGEWFRFDGPLKEFVEQLAPYVLPPARQRLPGVLGTWIFRNGHTGQSFAQLIGSSPAAISRICSGQQFPRRHLMLRIFEVTGGEVDANDLLGIPGRTKAEAAA
jgi:hypothetical protein